MFSTKEIALGFRIVVRKRAWQVRRIEKISSGYDLLTLVCLIELMKEDREACFFKEQGLNADINVVNPAATQPVAYTFTYRHNAMLQLETSFRAAPFIDAGGVRKRSNS